MFDAVKEVDEFVPARAGIFSRLGAMRVKIGCTRGTMKDTDQKENADPRKDYICW
jgi:hypothetical protein